MKIICTLTKDFGEAYDSRLLSLYFIPSEETMQSKSLKVKTIKKTKNLLNLLVIGKYFEIEMNKNMRSILLFLLLSVAE